jgi:putative nucleotidyltransferase with HDIG domain
MEEYGMLENIVSHSLEVTRVALYLSSELNKRGQCIDLGLVEAASLLHDIAKTPCLQTREDHTEAGYLLLKKIGYERVGRIVEQHVWLKQDGIPGSVSEEEVVNYADKRVRHDQIVSLRERFQDLKARYGRDQAAIEYLDRMKQAIAGVERKIFLILRIHPNALNQFLGKGGENA